MPKRLIIYFIALVLVVGGVAAWRLSSTRVPSGPREGEVTLGLGKVGTFAGLLISPSKVTENGLEVNVQSKTSDGATLQGSTVIDTKDASPETWGMGNLYELTLVKAEPEHDSFTIHIAKK